MTKQTEIKKLQKENEKLREELLNYTPYINRAGLIKLVNEIVENEIQQEELCGE